MNRILTASLLALAISSATLAPAMAEAPVNYVKIAKPEAGTPVLLVQPEVSLALLTAGGSQDPKEEWSQSARKFIGESLNTVLSNRKYKTSTIDLTTYEDPRALQILKLNDAVIDSIALSQIITYKLPTKTGFDWTLGDGVTTLVPADAAADAPPAYALFVRVKGSYSSGGRAAMMIGMAALGAAIPMGGQTIQASLVDLKSGKVVWYNFMGVAAGTDIRTAEGAAAAVNTLTANLPL
jgi:hypothetical protein